MRQWHCRVVLCHVEDPHDRRRRTGLDHRAYASRTIGATSRNPRVGRLTTVLAGDGSSICPRRPPRRAVEDPSPHVDGRSGALERTRCSRTSSDVWATAAAPRRRRYSRGSGAPRRQSPHAGGRDIDELHIRRRELGRSASRNRVSAPTSPSHRSGPPAARRRNPAAGAAPLAPTAVEITLRRRAQARCWAVSTHQGGERVAIGGVRFQLVEVQPRLRCGPFSTRHPVGSKVVGSVWVITSHSDKDSGSVSSLSLTSTSARASQALLVRPRQGSNMPRVFNSEGIHQAFEHRRQEMSDLSETLGIATYRWPNSRVVVRLVGALDCRSGPADR